MRFLLILLFAVPLAGMAQDCKIRTNKDPYTRETRLSTGFIAGDAGLLSVDADSKEIDVLISLEGADKCFDNNSSAYIFFEGIKSKTLVRNGGTMNCEGLFHFIFKNAANPTTTLQRFTTHKITHIIFTGNNKKETTLTFDVKAQEAIQSQAICLLKDAKTLIK